MKIQPLSDELRARLAAALESVQQAQAAIVAARQAQTSAVQTSEELLRSLQALLQSGRADADAAQQFNLWRAQIRLLEAGEPVRARAVQAALEALTEPLSTATDCVVEAFSPTKAAFIERLHESASALGSALDTERLVQQSRPYQDVCEWPHRLWMHRGVEVWAGNLPGCIAALLEGEVAFAFES